MRNRRRKKRNRGKNPEIKNQQNPIKLATADQLRKMVEQKAEVERLKQIISRPYSLGLTVLTTYFLFWTLITRKNAPLAKPFNNFIARCFSWWSTDKNQAEEITLLVDKVIKDNQGLCVDSLDGLQERFPGWYTKEKMFAPKIFESLVADGIEKIKKQNNGGIPPYHLSKAIRKGLADQLDDFNVLKKPAEAFIKYASREPQPTGFTEFMLKKIYDKKTALKIREDCIKTLRIGYSSVRQKIRSTLLNHAGGNPQIDMLFKNLKEVFSSPKKLDLSKLTTDELFWLVELLRNKSKDLWTRYAINYMSNMSNTIAKIYSILYYSLIKNFFKVIVIGALRHLISILSNPVIPLLPWMRRNTAPILLQPSELLTAKEAGKHLKEMSRYIEGLELSATKHQHCENYLYYTMAFITVAMFSSVEIGEIPGEFLFFFIAFTGSLLQKIASDFYQRVSDYRKDTQAYFFRNLFGQHLDEHFEVDASQTKPIELILSLKNNQPQDLATTLELNLVLENISYKCVDKTYFIKVNNHLYDPEAPNRIAENLNKANTALEEISELKEYLNQIQSVISDQQREVGLEKTFDQEGVPKASFYLNTRDERIINYLQERFSENCTTHETGYKWVIKLENLSLNQFNEFKKIRTELEELKAEFSASTTTTTRTKTKPTSKPSSDKEDSQTKTRKPKRWHTAQDSSSSEDEVTPSEKHDLSSIPNLPRIFQKAKPIQGLFPGNTTVLAIMTWKGTKKHPELLGEFDSLLQEPKIARHDEQRGLKTDAVRTHKKGSKHYKAKLLGKYGNFRLKADKHTFEHNDHQYIIHEFNKLARH